MYDGNFLRIPCNIKSIPLGQTGHLTNTFSSCIMMTDFSTKHDESMQMVHKIMLKYSYVRKTSCYYLSLYRCPLHCITMRRDLQERPKTACDVVWCHFQSTIGL